MKRSEINKQISWAKELLDKNRFKLPMFGHWTLDEWKNQKDNLENIYKTKLGWDVTDFGSGDFDKVGAVLFTIRNGIDDGMDVGTPYAEKVILMKSGQELPLHFHFDKMEDIINRGGGVLHIELYGSNEDGSIDNISDVTVYCDGVKKLVKAGDRIEILPGNSITLRPFVYHKFIAAKTGGDIIIGEVSKINDDSKDNHFAFKTKYKHLEIIEDVEMTHPLSSEYDAVLKLKILMQRIIDERRLTSLT